MDFASSASVAEKRIRLKEIVVMSSLMPNDIPSLWERKKEKIGKVKS